MLFEHGMSFFGMVEDSGHAIVASFDPSRFKPIDDIGLSAHGTDLYNLFHSKQVSRYTGIDQVGQVRVALFIALDDSSSVDARRRSKSFASKTRIFQRDGPSASLCRSVAILAQVGEII